MTEHDLKMAFNDGYEAGKECAQKELDALLADLTIACADVPNPCPVCGHWRTDWAKPGCELNGLTCKWCWRGVPEVRE